MLAGDFFENHQRYHKFFDLLEDPRGFRRYARLILDQKEEAADASCHTPWEVVFGGLMVDTGAA